jgi:hypothetical protein
VVIYTASTAKQPENRRARTVTQPAQHRAPTVAPSVKRPRFPTVLIDLFNMKKRVIQ